MPKTSEIVSAIENSKLKPKTVGSCWMLSQPIPVRSSQELKLGFFWYLFSAAHATIRPPVYKIVASIDTLSNISFIPLAHPKLIGIDVEPAKVIGKMEIKKPQDGELTLSQKEHQLYRLIDQILEVYPKASQNIIDDERELISEYQRIFAQIAPHSLLPAYHSLNPHFFGWIESSMQKRLN